MLRADPQELKRAAPPSSPLTFSTHQDSGALQETSESEPLRLLSLKEPSGESCGRRKPEFSQLLSPAMGDLPES